MSKVTIKKKVLWKAIRQYCLNSCAGGTAGVSECPDTECPLYEYRRGFSLQGKDKRIRKNQAS